MAEQWYYMVNRTKHGPVDLPTLMELVTAGRLSPHDLVWRDGMLEWTAVDQVWPEQFQWQATTTSQPGQPQPGQRPPARSPRPPTVSAARPTMPAARPNPFREYRWIFIPFGVAGLCVVGCFASIVLVTLVGTQSNFPIRQALADEFQRQDRHHVEVETLGLASAARRWSSSQGNIDLDSCPIGFRNAFQDYVAEVAKYAQWAERAEQIEGGPAADEIEHRRQSVSDAWKQVVGASAFHNIAVRRDVFDRQ